jgi:hypothetical protein
MADREMPDPSEHERVRAWRLRYELAVMLPHPECESAELVYVDGVRITYRDGEVRIESTRDGMSLTLDQVPGYIKALEGDVLEAQAEIRRQRGS